MVPAVCLSSATLASVSLPDSSTSITTSSAASLLPAGAATDPDTGAAACAARAGDGACVIRASNVTDAATATADMRGLPHLAAL